ncbi:MAG: cyclic nucleotide-binding domain-containing protein [Candidatus Hydrogenedentes bacterium]|nr:cyclic nucleotide-binding domain-containing protein [Candidatus Hydrogenedentota bacterium]
MKEKSVEYLIFREIPEKDVDRILTEGIIVSYNKDEVIFYEGSEGSHIYVILEGSVGIYKEDRLIAELCTGECIGEMGILTKRPRSATAKSLSKTKLLVVSENTLNKMLHKKVAIKFLLNIIFILSERIRILNEKTTKQQSHENLD